MVQLDPEVYLACAITICIGAGATAALVAVLVRRVRQLTYPNTHHFRTWTRFQKLAICTCSLGIIFYLTSIIELLLVMYISPENLTKTAAAIPGVWNKGVPKFLVSLAESIGQILLSLTVYCYFLILMERLAAFRFLLSARLFRIMYTPVFVLGTLLFVQMLLCTILINTVSLSDPEVEVLILGSAALIFGSIIIELVLSIALCRTFFVRKWEQRRQESWSLSRRVPNRSFSATEDRPKSNTTSSSAPQFNLSTRRTPDLTEHAQTSPIIDTSSASAQAASISHSNPSDLSNTLVVIRPAASTPHSRSDSASAYSLATVLRDSYQRRTLLLFVAIVLTDFAGVLFYVLSIVPEAQAISRPLEIIGRTTIGIHLMLALIFLESFKQILHPDYSGTEISTVALTGL
ncbi:hypothetical protein BJ742DRAFT_789395 [Cladochytrium replicatum]|nr:hypothetical protein BJ742DRAFT_789395 [Cladochytrium replicatum]